MSAPSDFAYSRRSWTRWRAAWCVAMAPGAVLAVMIMPVQAGVLTTLMGVFSITWHLILCAAAPDARVRNPDWSTSEQLIPTWDPVTATVGFCVLGVGLYGYGLMSFALSYVLVGLMAATAPALWGLLRLAVGVSPSHRPRATGVPTVHHVGAQNQPVAAVVSDASQPVPSSSSRPFDCAPEARRFAATLSDHVLCVAWRRSYVRLERAPTCRQTLAVVQMRQAFLDEMLQRDPGGVQAWLASGGRAASGPERYLRGDDTPRDRPHLRNLRDQAPDDGPPDNSAEA